MIRLNRRPVAPPNESCVEVTEMGCCSKKKEAEKKQTCETEKKQTEKKETCKPKKCCG